jgi:hypothetical protein
MYFVPVSCCRAEKAVEKLLACRYSRMDLCLKSGGQISIRQFDMAGRVVRIQLFPLSVR